MVEQEGKKRNTPGQLFVLIFTVIIVLSLLVGVAMTGILYWLVHIDLGPSILGGAIATVFAFFGILKTR